MENEKIIDDLLLVIGTAHVHGRGSPSANVDACPYGINVRIDFAAYPDLWAEVMISWEQIQLVSAMAKAFFAKQEKELEAIKKRRMTANGDKLT